MLLRSLQRWRQKVPAVRRQLKSAIICMHPDQQRLFMQPAQQRCLTNCPARRSHNQRGSAGDYEFIRRQKKGRAASRSEVSPVALMTSIFHTVTMAAIYFRCHSSSQNYMILHLRENLSISRRQLNFWSNSS